MKKAALVFLLLCAFASAQAQWVVSGNLGYSRSGLTVTKFGDPAFDGTQPQGWSLEFSPRIGYSFNGNIAVGVQLGFIHSDYTYTSGIYSNLTNQWVESQELLYRRNNYSAGLYLRKFIHSWGDLTLHAEILVNYGIGRGYNHKTEYRLYNYPNQDPYYEPITTSRLVHSARFAAQIVPVFNYSFGNRFSMDAYMNFASLIFSHNTTELYSEQSNITDGDVVEDRTVTTDLDLGIRTLNTSIITLGFSYTF